MVNPLFDALFGQHKGKGTPFLQLIDGSVVTHDDFLQSAARYANLFNELGVNPGDRVAVQIDKSIPALAVYAACIQAGIVLLPLNPAYTADEMAYFVDNSGARLILCDSAREEYAG